MNVQDMDPRVKELHLMMLYVTGWKEQSRNRFGKDVFMTWKGYVYEVLNDLEREGLIRQTDSMVFFTPEGIRRAEIVRRKYW